MSCVGCVNRMIKEGSMCMKPTMNYPVVASWNTISNVNRGLVIATLEDEVKYIICGR